MGEPPPLTWHTDAQCQLTLRTFHACIHTFTPTYLPYLPTGPPGIVTPVRLYQSVPWGTFFLQTVVCLCPQLSNRLHCADECPTRPKHKQQQNKNLLLGILFLLDQSSITCVRFMPNRVLSKYSLSNFHCSCFGLIGHSSAQCSLWNNCGHEHTDRVWTNTRDKGQKTRTNRGLGGEKKKWNLLDFINLKSI